MIYRMARDRNEESKDVKRGSVIKDKNGTLITDHNAVLHVWETYFTELLNKTDDSELELPSSVREKTEVVEITDRYRDDGSHEEDEEREGDRLR